MGDAHSILKRLEASWDQVGDQNWEGRRRGWDEYALGFVSPQVEPRALLYS